MDILYTAKTSKTSFFINIVTGFEFKAYNLFSSSKYQTITVSSLKFFGFVRFTFWDISFVSHVLQIINSLQRYIVLSFTASRVVCMRCSLLSMYIKDQIFRRLFSKKVYIQSFEQSFHLRNLLGFLYLKK